MSRWHTSRTRYRCWCTGLWIWDRDDGIPSINALCVVWGICIAGPRGLYITHLLIRHDRVGSSRCDLGVLVHQADTVVRRIVSEDSKLDKLNSSTENELIKVICSSSSIGLLTMLYLSHCSICFIQLPSHHYRNCTIYLRCSKSVGLKYALLAYLCPYQHLTVTVLAQKTLHHRYPSGCVGWPTQSVLLAVLQ